MPRKLIRRFLPERKKLTDQKLFQFFGTWLSQSSLWHLGRHNVAAGVAIGLFCAFLPMPMETLIAILMAIVFRGNILVAAALVWISNPFTWPFLYGSAYLIGNQISQNMDFFNLDFFINYKNAQRYLALWIGCLIIGPCVALCGYLITHWLWRFHVVSMWKQRRLSRKNKTMHKNINKSLKQTDIDAF